MPIDVDAVTGAVYGTPAGRRTACRRWLHAWLPMVLGPQPRHRHPKPEGFHHAGVPDGTPRGSAPGSSGRRRRAVPGDGGRPQDAGRRVPSRRRERDAPRAGGQQVCDPLPSRAPARRTAPKTKGKVERPFRHIRQDFFLARRFRDLDNLNRQFGHWRTTVANPRTHDTTGRVVDEAFADGRRISRDGMASVAGNLYGVPDATRRRVVEVQNHPGQCGSSRTAT